MDLRDLRALITVNEFRHFGRAAEKLGLSQSAVSKSIQRLERDLGVTLFDRSRAHVEPTALCIAVVARARLILAGVADLDRTVRMHCGLEIGSIAVGIGPAMSESYVTNALAHLAQEHPGVQIDVRVDHWRQLSTWLAAGEIDLLVADIADAVDDTRYLVRPLPAEQLTWFCRPEHPLAKAKQVTREDLLEYPLATPRMPPWAMAWFQEVLTGKKKTQSPVALPTIRCENYSMLKRIVLQSDCISAALMDTIRFEIQEQRLCALNVKPEAPKTNAGIVQFRDRTLSPLATAFVRQVEALASELSR